MNICYLISIDCEDPRDGYRYQVDKVCLFLSSIPSIIEDFLRDYDLCSCSEKLHVEIIQRELFEKKPDEKGVK